MVLHNHRLHPHGLLSAHPPGCILNAAAREKWENHGASKCDSGALCAPNATLHSTVHNASKCDVPVAQGGQSGGVSTASIIKQERQNVHFPTGKGRRNAAPVVGERFFTLSSASSFCFFAASKNILQ